MDKLRAIGEWIARRKYLSSFIAILFIAAVVVARYLAFVNSGTLSEPIQRGKIIDAVYGIGTVTPNKRLSVNPMVANTLRKIFVREGDRVKQGAPLYMTDDGNKINAPFDGVANYSPYRVGENAYTTAPVLVFTDLSDLYVVVSMEQQGALRVKVGQDVKLSFDSLRKQNFEGKVNAVYSYSNNFLARIDSIQLPPSVLPDMTCDVAIVIGIHDNALLIPTAAFDNGKVWVKRGDGLPHRVSVKLGVTDGATSEVLEGDLQPGDRVMIRTQVGS